MIVEITNLIIEITKYLNSILYNIFYVIILNNEIYS